LRNALNARLPNDIAASSVVVCDVRFHPRFDATWREYRYWIAPTVISPFLRRYAWMLRSGVTVDAVRAGASRLIGTHDFASFAGGGEGVPWSRRAAQPRGTRRTIFLCDCREFSFSHELWASRHSTGLEIRVVADGFLPRMVRNIVGALVEIGQGKQDPVWIDELLEARDRRLGSVVAPAQGLVLWRVGFGEDSFDDV
jgi:tRNA pseudouridine38-40 synthase